MITRLPRSLVLAVATVVMVLPFIRVSGQMPARAPRYAITNAKIVTAAGPAIEKGTVVMRDGVIEDVGPLVAAPSDALIVEGSGLVVYPGLIDMSNPALVEARTTGRRRRRRPPRADAGAVRPSPPRTASPGRTRSAKRERVSCTRTSTRQRWSSSRETICGVWPRRGSRRPWPCRRRASFAARAPS